MVEREQPEDIDNKLIKRAQHYLRVVELLDKSDDETIRNWRGSVADRVQVAHDIFQRIDPQCDNATLKKVAYRQHDSSTDLTIISEKSIMLWPLPGRLHSFDACHIGLDGVLYVTPSQGSSHIEKPAHEMSDKDLLFLEHSLNQLFESQQGTLIDEDFNELFNEK
jgi:hypothetical protein